ncbi:MAG: hypothetical protein K0Q70_2008 [Rhodospirillales bacterium]|nr:hypothetical protein [Rhodospirillales bacterium]
MRKTFVIGIGIAALIAAAVALRLHDAPYIAFVEGQRAAVTEGLSRKAQQGDGFAALLIAKNYLRGDIGVPDREKAADWYLTAAQSGEIRAIAPFIGLALTPASATPDRCRISISLLDNAGRTGELNALMTLGRYYETGLCVETDLAMAARYYMSATRIDGRFGIWVDAIVHQIEPDIARELTPRPDTFDMTQSTALTQFLAAAPALR